MLLSAVHVKHQPIHPLEHTFVLRPPIQHVCYLQPRHTRETLREKLHTGIEFVHSRRMTRLPRDEQQLPFAIRGPREGRPGGNTKEQQNEGAEEGKSNHGAKRRSWFLRPTLMAWQTDMEMTL